MTQNRSLHDLLSRRCIIFNYWRFFVTDTNTLSPRLIKDSRERSNRASNCTIHEKFRLNKQAFLSTPDLDLFIQRILRDLVARQPRSKIRIPFARDRPAVLRCSSPDAFYVCTISFIVRLSARVCRSELFTLRARNSKYTLGHAARNRPSNRVIDGARAILSFVF